MSQNGLNLKVYTKFLKWQIISYTLDHLKLRVFFGLLSRAGVDQPLSAFWTVTQSPVVGYQGIIPPLEGDM